MKLLDSGKRTCLLLSAFLATASLLRADQSYTVTDLGTLGGSESLAFAINDSGEITGGSTNTAGAYDASCTRTAP